MDNTQFISEISETLSVRTNKWGKSIVKNATLHYNLPKQLNDIRLYNSEVSEKIALANASSGNKYPATSNKEEYEVLFSIFLAKEGIIETEESPKPINTKSLSELLDVKQEGDVWESKSAMSYNSHFNCIHLDGLIGSLERLIKGGLENLESNINTNKQEKILEASYEFLDFLKNRIQTSKPPKMFLNEFLHECCHFALGNHLSYGEWDREKWEPPFEGFAFYLTLEDSVMNDRGVFDVDALSKSKEIYEYPEDIAWCVDIIRGKVKNQYGGINNHFEWSVQQQDEIFERAMSKGRDPRLEFCYQMLLDKEKNKIKSLAGLIDESFDGLFVDIYKALNNAEKFLESDREFPGEKNLDIIVSKFNKFVEENKLPIHEKSNFWSEVYRSLDGRYGNSNYKELNKEIDDLFQEYFILLSKYIDLIEGTENYFKQLDQKELPKDIDNKVLNELEALRMTEEEINQVKNKLIEIR